MKKSQRVSNQRPAARRARAFRAGGFACALLLFVGVATAVATYASRSVEQPQAERSAVAPEQAGNPFITVDVGGRRMRVNAQTLQQGPLTQSQSQQLAEQLEGNKTTDGLVEEKHEDGTVSIDLQGRFQNVTLAKRNDDGSVSSACVDTPEAAGAFLRSQEKTPTITGTGVNGKVASRQ